MKRDDLVGINATVPCFPGLLAQPASMWVALRTRYLEAVLQERLREPFLTVGEPQGGSRKYT
jgi:hypothetical protein